jgi:hypothetical protein
MFCTSGYNIENLGRSVNTIPWGRSAGVLDIRPRMGEWTVDLGSSVASGQERLDFRANASAVNVALPTAKAVPASTASRSGLNGRACSRFNHIRARELLIAPLVRARDGDGVNINFEGVQSDSRNRLTGFIEALADIFHNVIPGSQASCARTDFGTHPGDWDLAAIDPYVDLFFLQGYGYHDAIGLQLCADW